MDCADIAAFGGGLYLSHLFWQKKSFLAVGRCVSFLSLFYLYAQQSVFILLEIIFHFFPRSPYESFPILLHGMFWLRVSRRWCISVCLVTVSRIRRICAPYLCPAHVVYVPHIYMYICMYIYMCIYVPHICVVHAPVSILTHAQYV